MKKNILTCLSLLLIGFQSEAKESSSYFKFGVGYHLPTMQQEMQNNNYRFDWNKGDFMESAAKYSLHKGVGPMISFGHMFNANVGFEVGADYLFNNGSKSWQGIEFEGKSIYDEVKIKSSNLNLYPSIRLAIPLGKKVSLYSRSGLVIPLLSKITRTMTSAFYDTAGIYYKPQITTVTKNRFAVGFTGALGIDIKISPRVSVNAEIAGQMLNVWTKSEKITGYSLNGYDRFSELNPRELETKYLKEVDVFYGNGSTALMPPYGLSTQHPFHSIGFNVGMSFGI